MANPQIENGHTDIANSLIEALAKTRIPGEAHQVLDFMFRKIYGWHKKEDVISLSQISAGTGLSKPHICVALKTLKKMGVITEKGKGITEMSNEIGRRYAIIKDFDLWKPLPKRVTPLLKRVKSITQMSNKSLLISDTTKESIKEKKEIKYCRSQKPSDPRIKEIIDYWYEMHRVNSGNPPLVTGKEAKQIKQLLSVTSMETLKGFIQSFFDDQDAWIVERGKTWSIFYSLAFPKYQSQNGKNHKTKFKSGDY